MNASRRDENNKELLYMWKKKSPGLKRVGDGQGGNNEDEESPRQQTLFFFFPPRSNFVYSQRTI